MQNTFIIHFTNNYHEKIDYSSIFIEGDIVTKIYLDELIYEKNENDENTIESSTYLPLKDKVNLDNDEILSMINLYFSENPILKQEFREYPQKFGWYPLENLLNMDITTSFEIEKYPLFLKKWENFLSQAFSECKISYNKKTNYHILQEHYDKENEQLQRTFRNLFL